MDRKLQNWIANAVGVARTVVMLMLVLGWITLLSYEDQVERTSPRVPTSATGETVPVHWKSVIVYVRPVDARIIKDTDYFALPAGIGLIAFSFFRVWRGKTKGGGEKR